MGKLTQEKDSDGSFWQLGIDDYDGRSPRLPAGGRERERERDLPNHPRGIDHDVLYEIQIGDLGAAFAAILKSGQLFCQAVVYLFDIG